MFVTPMFLWTWILTSIEGIWPCTLTWHDIWFAQNLELVDVFVVELLVRSIVTIIPNKSLAGWLSSQFREIENLSW
jgi:hypothetical protein